jgi:hypothetical protein
MNKEDYREIHPPKTDSGTFREEPDIQQNITTDAATRTRDNTRAAHELSFRHKHESERKASRKKWIGWGLFSLGLVTTFATFPLYLFWAVYLKTWLFLGLSSLLTVAGLGTTVAGGILALSRPKIGENSQALIIAMKHGNTLTVTRLALEMDISFKKAERIVQDLVRSGVAEIDMEHSGTANSIVYRVRGL